MIDFNKYKNIIWDLDGTLIDSMGMWDTLAEGYLESIGEIPKEDMHEHIDTMTLGEAVCYLIASHNLKKTKQQVFSEIDALIEYKYANEIVGKTDIIELLKAQHANKKRMCVLTTSSQTNAIKVCDRLEITGMVEQIISTDTLSMNKRSKEVYLKTIEILGYNIEDTLVFEDSLYAIEAAKLAGLDVVGVRDNANDSDWEEIKNISDYTV